MSDDVTKLIREMLELPGADDPAYLYRLGVEWVNAGEDSNNSAMVEAGLDVQGLALAELTDKEKK